MNIIICFFYALIGIYIALNLKNKNKKNGFIGAYSGIAFGMILYYCIIPILVIINMEELANRSEVIEKFLANKTTWELIFPAIVVLIGFFIFNCAYNQSNKQEKVKRIEFNEEKLFKITKFIAYTTLIVGGVSLIAYFTAFRRHWQGFYICRDNEIFQYR